MIDPEDVAIGLVFACLFILGAFVGRTIYKELNK